MNEPMTDERLAEIRRLTATVLGSTIFADFDEATAWFAILDLRRENDRLRAREQALEAENAAMRPIVETVADLNDPPFWQPMKCPACHQSWRFMENHHADDCPFAQARAFIAAHPTATAGETESEGE